MKSNHILLVLPAITHDVQGRIFFDAQGSNGLRLWLKHFTHVTMVCPTQSTSNPPPLTRPLDSIQGSDRLTYVALPVAYKPLRFFANLPGAIKVLADLVPRADYLNI